MFVNDNLITWHKRVSTRGHYTGPEVCETCGEDLKDCPAYHWESVDMLGVFAGVSVRCTLCETEHDAR